MEQNKAKPWIIYKNLSDKNKQQFWTVSISVFITMLAIWIGTAFQLIAIGESSTEAKKVEHAQIINTLIPFRDKYISTCDSLLPQMLSIEDSPTKENDIYSIGLARTLSWADSCFNICEVSKYYLPENDCKKITNNDFMVDIALPALKDLSDTIVSGEFDNDVYIWKYILGNLKRMDLDPANTSSIEKGNIANVAVFREELKQLFDFCMELQSSKTELLEEAKKSELSREGLLRTTQQYLAFADSINRKKMQLTYKYVVSSLIENYYIINSNILPYKESKINIIPKTKKDLLLIWEGIKDVGVSSNFGSTMFSLIVFLIVGFIIWYLILLLVFKKGNETEKVTDSNWIENRVLEQQIREKREYIQNIYKISSDNEKK